MTLTLRFPNAAITEWATRYDYQVTEVDPVRAGAGAMARGHLTRPEFLEITKWKTRRTQKSCARNPADYVEAITAASLSATHERVRIEVLTLLDGVSWATASVILHFCTPDRYPILDFRALWSLSSETPESDYDFAFWWEYCEATRAIAADTSQSMRTIDRALWAYSKYNQPARVSSDRKQKLPHARWPLHP